MRKPAGGFGEVFSPEYSAFCAGNLAADDKFGYTKLLVQLKKMGSKSVAWNELAMHSGVNMGADVYRAYADRKQLG